MRLLVLTACGLLIGTMPAVAQANVDFTGSVNSTCSIVAHSDGSLGLNTTTGDVLSSEVAPGGPGTVTILSIGTDNEVDIAAPTRTNQPGDYVSTGEAIQVSYTGATGLSFVNEPFTSSATSFEVDTIAASVLTLHNRITNPNGFAPGNYATQTVVSCTANP